MITWKLLTDVEALAGWDDALLRLDDANVFQSYAWGQYRRALGWEPCHWAAYDEQGEIVAMMMGLLRRYPFKFGLVWCEGGPVGDLSACDERLHETIKQTTGLKRIYCRFRCDRQRSVEDSLQLNSIGWNRSWFNLTSNYSMMLDLSQDENQTLEGCERNWRRNLARAREANLNVRQWLNPSVDEVLQVYGSMQTLKGIDEQNSRDEVQQLMSNLKRHLVLYRCDDENGELVSLHGMVVFENRAWAVFSATSERGRKLQASYLTFWALIQHGQRLQLRSWDLAGIDPVNNPGVYRFKKGTGAAPVEYLGEWDWATSEALRWFGNWAISRRQRVQRAAIAFQQTTSGEGREKIKAKQADQRKVALQHLDSR